MQVETSRFGTIEAADDEVVSFPEGLPGFADLRRMVLLGGGRFPGSAELEDHHSLFWLQDVDDPDVAFLTIVPWSAYPDYDIEIDPSDVDDAAADDLCVLSIVTVRREHGGVQLTSNLLAPVVIDTATRVGRQIILDDGAWPVHAPLASSPAPDAASEAS